MNKIIYYYQTLVSLKNLLNNSDKIYPTHIILSSFHFGIYSDDRLYMHLNDNEPDDNIFNNLWKELLKAHNLGIKIMIMVGGAGGAYSSLFTSYYKKYYCLLSNFLKKHYYISGIDLDVEEIINVNNLKKLINDINIDFGEDFIITMAPTSYALSTNNPGLGNFIYKQFLSSNEGKRINWLNCQSYYNYSFDNFTSIINNGYSPDKIVYGMVCGQFDKNTFHNCLNEIYKIKKKYNNFGGAFVWEFINAPSLSNKSEDWCVNIYDCIIYANYYKKK